MNLEHFKPSLGALVGAGIGAIGGLFAPGIAPAILTRDLAVFRATPTLSMICWVVTGLLGWLLGGPLGLWLNRRFEHRNAEVAGGTAGGLFAISVVALWAWYQVTH